MHKACQFRSLFYLCSRKHGSSSVGRAPVSKTGCREFEPLLRANIYEMKKVVAYIKESYDELVHKVSWPTYSELTNSAVVVLYASLLIALVVFAMDFCFQNFMEK